MAIRLNGLMSGLDTDSIVNAMTSTYTARKNKLVKAQTKNEWTQDIWKNMNKKIYDFYSSTLSSTRLSSNFESIKTRVSDDSIVKVSANKDAPITTQNLKVKSLVASGYLTGAHLQRSGKITSLSKMSEVLGGVDYPGKIAVTINGEVKNIAMTDDMTVAQFMSHLKDFGLNASFDENNQRFFISSKETGANSNFKLAGADKEGNATLEKLGLASSAGAVYIEGKDAEIELNGVTYTNNSNNFNINGLSLEITGLTKENQITSISVNKNNDAIYNQVKDFITKYNDLLKSMNESYNAKSSKGYEPLLDEEKDKMTDSQIEKWEKTIKDSLLRKDEILGNIINTFKSSMSKSFNGLSLSTFGITQGNYFSTSAEERGIFHIDGDEDDNLVSNKTNKLRDWINKDPNAVINFMQNLATDLYNNLTEKMKSTSLRSSYTLYNDKQMKSQHDKYIEQIKNWEKKISDQENKYYKQFATMEKMLSNLNSQTSSLTSLFGM